MADGGRKLKRLLRQATGARRVADEAVQALQAQLDAELDALVQRICAAYRQEQEARRAQGRLRVPDVGVRHVRASTPVATVPPGWS